MDNATLITIISTVIGTGATVITLNMVFILKFIKEPLDKKIDRLEDNLQSQINKLEDNLQSQINNVDRKVDKLYELLLAYHMNGNK